MNNLKIISLNTYKRINTHLDHIFLLANRQNADIILLQETTILKNSTLHKIQNRYNSLVLDNEGSKNGRGTCIIVKNKLSGNISNNQILVQGRCQSLCINHNNILYHIVNIYAPNKTNEKKAFFQTIEPNIIKNFTIIGGDFNTISDINVDVDRWGHRIQPYTPNMVQPLTNLILNYNLIDIWRQMNPTKRRYTYHNNTIQTKSRIDKFLITPDIQAYNCQSDIIDTTFSDHNTITLTLTSPNKHDRDTTWKLNTSLLTDTDITSDFKILWENMQILKYDLHPHDWWEMAKHRTRSFFQIRGKIKKTDQGLREDTIRQLLVYLYEARDGGIDEQEEEIEILERELAKMDNLKLEGLKIRARATDLEKDEKGTAYFYNLHRKHTTQKMIEELKDEAGNICKGKEKITIVYNHFNNLYGKTEVVTDTPVIDQYTKTTHGKFTDDTAEILGKPISYQEGLNALKLMKNNKSPGDDGLPKEFYQKFWPIIGRDVIEMLNNSFRMGKLPKSTRRGKITLIHKKNSTIEIKNYRPVSLLNIDYKICSKVLTERLKSPLSAAIHHNQACGIKGRTIHDHLNLIKEIIEYTENEGNYKGGISILAVDQSQAFDRIEHSYLFRCLMNYNTGNQFIQWVKTLYNSATTYCKIMGESTEEIHLRRSMRQGCSLSMLLFILALDPFLEHIRINRNITGFRLTNGNFVKTIAYADDINFFVHSQQEINTILNEFNEYSNISGAKLNAAKTEILQIGSHTSNMIAQKYKQYITNDIKLLGIQFSRHDTTKQNYTIIANKITNLLTWWKTRCLTIYGKAQIINTVLLAQFWHTAKVFTNPPRQIIDQINSEIFKFLWHPQRIQQINKETIHLPEHKGGLNIIDIQTKIDMLNILRFTDPITNTQKSWHILQAYKHDFTYEHMHAEYTRKSTTHSEYTHIKYKTALTQIKKYNLDIKIILATNIKLKDLYTQALKIKNTKPKVITLYPLINFREIFEMQCAQILPNHIRQTNFKTIHEAFMTSYKLKHKYKITNSDLCRRCGKQPETLSHILIECHNNSKQFTLNIHPATNSQIIMKEPINEHHKHYTWSIYRHVILEHHLTSHTPKTDRQINMTISAHLKKYRDLFRPP